MFFLLYNHTDNGVFDDFPKISDHFPKIYEDSPKLFRRPDERSRTFSENFRKFPKMSEDFRRFPKTFEGDPKLFRWYTNEFKYNLRDKRDITEIIDIFTCEDIASFLSITAISKKRNLCLDNWTHRLGFESARAALCKWAACMRQGRVVQSPIKLTQG